MGEDKSRCPLSPRDEKLTAFVFFTLGMAALACFNAATLISDLWDYMIGTPNNLMFKLVKCFNTPCLPCQFVYILYVYHLKAMWRSTPAIAFSVFWMVFTMIAFPIARANPDIMGGIETTLYVITAIAGTMNAIYGAALFSLAAQFQSGIVISAVMAGQGLAGLFPSCLRIIQTLFETFGTSEISDNTWYMYWGINLIMVIPALFLWPMLYRKPAIAKVLREMDSNSYWGLIDRRPGAIRAISPALSPVHAASIAEAPTILVAGAGEVGRDRLMPAQGNERGGRSEPAPSSDPGQQTAERLSPMNRLSHDLPAPHIRNGVDRVAPATVSPPARSISPIVLAANAAQRGELGLRQPPEQITAGQALLKILKDLFSAFSICWLEGLSTMTVFLFTLAFYPGNVVTQVPAPSGGATKAAWWSTIMTFIFVFLDWVARSFPQSPKLCPKTTVGRYVTIAMPFIRIPICTVLFYFSFARPKLGYEVTALTEVIQFVNMIFFSFTNGYLSTLLVGWGPLRGKTDTERNLAGAWISLWLNAGLTFGSLLSEPISNLLK